MANFKSTIPQRLKERNLSVNRFSQKTGFNRYTATLLANGEMPGNTEDVFERLVEFFDCQLSDLFIHEDAMKITEGLIVEEVVHLKAREILNTDDELTIVYEGEKIKSLCWFPKPENWMAAEIMRILLKKESE